MCPLSPPRAWTPLWRSGCCDPSSPWDSPEDHSWMELSTPGPSWGQNQLWIKEELISCHQTPSFYLQFPLPPAGCCCGTQGRWEPLHHPLCQPWSCQKSSPPSPSPQHVMEKPSRAGSGQGGLGAGASAFLQPGFLWDIVLPAPLCSWELQDPVSYSMKALLLLQSTLRLLGFFSFP